MSYQDDPRWSHPGAAVPAPVQPGSAGPPTPVSRPASTWAPMPVSGFRYGPGGEPAPPIPAGGRQRPGRIAVLAAAIVTLVVGAAIGYPLGLLTRPATATGSTAASAVALYRQALAATTRSAGFHYVSSSVGDPTDQRTVGDAGAAGGDQIITVTSTYGHEQFALVMVSAVVYFQGNVPALEDQLGIAALSAAGLAGTWISVSRGDGPYSVIEPGITIADQAACIVLTPTSVARITTSDGAPADRVVGAVPASPPCTVNATGHLDLATRSHLPRAFVWTTKTGSGAVTYTTTFTGWGSASAATAPVGSVAWTTLGATRPPGGYGVGGGSPNTATPSPTLPT